MNLTTNTKPTISFTERKKTRKPWTDEELDIIRANPDITAEKLAQKVSHDKNSCKNKLCQMRKAGMIPSKRGSFRKWTPEDDEWLVANANLSGAEKAQHLNRSQDAIYQRGNFLRRAKQSTEQPTQLSLTMPDQAESTEAANNKDDMRTKVKKRIEYHTNIANKCRSGIETCRSEIETRKSRMETYEREEQYHLSIVKELKALIQEGDEDEA